MKNNLFIVFVYYLKLLDGASYMKLLNCASASETEISRRTADEDCEFTRLDNPLMFHRVEHSERLLTKANAYSLGFTRLEISLLESLELLLRTYERTLIVLYIHLRDLSTCYLAGILHVAYNELCSVRGLNTQM